MNLDFYAASKDPILFIENSIPAEAFQELFLMKKEAPTIYLGNISCNLHSLFLYYDLINMGGDNVAALIISHANYNCINRYDLKGWTSFNPITGEFFGSKMYQLLWCKRK